MLTRPQAGTVMLRTSRLPVLGELQSTSTTGWTPGGSSLGGHWSSIASPLYPSVMLSWKSTVTSVAPPFSNRTSHLSGMRWGGGTMVVPGKYSSRVPPAKGAGFQPEEGARMTLTV